MTRAESRSSRDEVTCSLCVKVSAGMLKNAVAKRALMMKMKNSVVVAIGGGA